MARDQKLVLETQEKSTINTVTTLSELLEKYGNNAKILKIKFSQLISLIKCCKDCLAITSGPGCLISQTGKCNLQRSFNISKFSLFEEVQTKLTEANTAIEKQNTIVESKEAEIRVINDRIARDQKLTEMMAPLSKEQKEVMESLLESVTTPRLDSSFKKYLPAVLKNDAKATKKVLAETKEVTGNKKELTKDQDEGNIIEIKRLAGLQT